MPAWWYVCVGLRGLHLGRAPLARTQRLRQATAALFSASSHNGFGLGGLLIHRGEHLRSRSPVSTNLTGASGLRTGFAAAPAPCCLSGDLARRCCWPDGCAQHIVLCCAAFLSSFCSASAHRGEFFLSRLVHRGFHGTGQPPMVLPVLTSTNIQVHQRGLFATSAAVLRADSPPASLMLAAICDKGVLDVGDLSRERLYCEADP